MVIRIVWVGGRGAAEQRNSVMALTRLRYALIVDDLWQRKPAGNKGEGRCGVSILTRVEARKTKVEVRFQSAVVRMGDLVQSRSSTVEIAIGILCFAERQQRCRIARSKTNSLLQSLDTFVGCRRVDATDIVLESTERNGLRTEEGLFRDSKVGQDVVRDLPGNGVLDIEQTGKLARVLQGMRHTEPVDVEHLRLRRDASIIDVVAANNDVVGVKCPGDANG